MKIKYIFTTIVVFTILVVNLAAQGDIITAKQFKKLNKNIENLIVIDASKTKLYKKAHLKNAISVPYKILNVKKGEGGVSGLLKSPDELAKILGEKGVSNDDFIVVYDEGSQKYSSRVYWVLKYLGVKDVKILHKDNTSWRKARLPLTSAPAKTKVKTFEPMVDNSVLATVGFIESNLGKDDFVLIDARGAKEYSGIMDEKKNKYSKGHLPGAIHISFKDVLNEDKSFKSVEDMKKIADANGFTADKTFVVYCKTGVKASVVFVALKNVLDYSDIRLYDGAYLEWEHIGKPIEK